MKKKIASVLAICALSLSACNIAAPKPIDNPATSVSEVSVSEDIKASVEPVTSTDEVVDEPDFIPISEAEMKYFTDFIQKDYNYGFLLSTYSDVRYADLSEVFYAGDTSYRATNEDFDRYLELSGYDELGTGLAVISKERMNEILLKTTGYKYDEFFYYPYTVYGPTYDYDTEKLYIPRGDTNYFEFEVIEGYHSNGTVVLYVVPTAEFDYLGEAGYYVTPREVVLDRVGKEYHFLSCRELIDQGIIPEHCYSLYVPRFGEVNLMTYAPTQGNYDVTFKMVHDGEIVETLQTQIGYQNTIDKTFVSVDQIEFGDFNTDGWTDFIAVIKYLEESNEYSYEYKVYAGGEQGFFAYYPMYADFALNKVPEYDAGKAMSSLYEEYGSSATWKMKYIEALSEIPEDEYPGHTFIMLDDNELPELVCIGDCEASGNQVLTCYNDKISKIYLNRLYFTYIYRSGLLNNCEGHMGYYFDDVYELKDGVFWLIGEGVYEDDMNSEPDEEGYYPVIYNWNGFDVSKEQYYESLENIYNSGYANDGYIYGETLSREEVLGILEGIWAPLF